MWINKGLIKNNKIIKKIKITRINKISRYFWFLIYTIDNTIDNTNDNTIYHSIFNCHFQYSMCLPLKNKILLSVSIRKSIFSVCLLKNKIYVNILQNTEHPLYYIRHA